MGVLRLRLRLLEAKRFILRACFLSLLCSGAIAETPFQGRADIGNLFPIGGGFATHSLNGTTDAVESFYSAKEAGTFDQICIRTATNAGDPPAYKVGVQGMNTSSDPVRANGTYKTGSGECSATYDPPSGTGDDNTEKCFSTTGTTCSIAAGEIFAIVVVPTGTPDGSNYLQVAYAQNNAFNDTSWMWNNVEHVLTIDAATPTDGSYIPIWYLKNSSTNVYYGNPIKTYHQNYFSDATNPDEYCNRIYYTFPTGCTYKIRGGVIRWGQAPAANGSWTLTLYGPDGVDGGTDPDVLNDLAIDSDQVSAASGNRWHEHFFDDTLQALSSATEYFLCARNTGSPNGYIAEVEVENNNEFTAWPGGKEIYKATRDGGTGAFSTTSTRRMYIAPIWDSLTCTSGGGSLIDGGLIH